MVRRAYDGTHREEQARQTRERVLDSVIAALARREEISVQALAKAAGVSVPTVYRNFPTRDALMDATQEAIGARLRRPDWPESPDDLAARVPDRYAWFEANGVLIRAILASPLGREILASVQRRRERAMTRSMAPRISHLAPARARAVLAIVSMLDDAHTWRQLRDAWRVPAEDAAWAAQWALATLLAELSREHRPEPRRPFSKSRKKRRPR
jgi:AcrR family transcriptional regulator